MKVWHAVEVQLARVAETPVTAQLWSANTTGLEISEDTPEAIALAWDEEIARRVADMDAGKTVWIPADEVFARLDAIIEKAR